MKKILLLILLFSTLATASTISFSPAPTGSPGIIYSNSVVFKITTTSPVLCGYSEDNATSFELIAGNFDDNLETIHKKTITTTLLSKVHKYYVKCRPINDRTNPSAETTHFVTFTTSRPISAQISLSESSLKAGKYEITLQTSKIPASTPSLKYSFDGITYTPIVLYGSGNTWKGFLVIPSSLGEKVGLFKFDATDVEGRPGNEITKGNVFTVDTKAPPLITSIEASGEYGQIKLKWFFDEDEETNKVNIYRSESPNVGLTNLYKTIDNDKEYYYDTNTESGKTYYYRISLEDEAGNRADLSREVQATSLLSETTTATGLAPLLIGSVDALLSEIELLETDIKNSDDMIGSLSETEKKYLKIFKITDNLQSAKSELTILKRNIEGYKLTDITKEILDGKLSSSRIKLNILKKKIPDTFTTIDSSENSFKLTDDILRKTILEYSPELSPNEIDKTIKNSLKSIEENNLQITSKINVFETIYLDGTKTTQSIIEHFLDGTLERAQNSKFILQLPSGSLNLNSLSVKNLDYTPEQEGLISFETDTKKITYTLDQKLDTQILEEIAVSLIVFQEETISLTGYFLSEIPEQGSVFVIFLVFMASGLIGYLLYIKQQQKKEVSLDFLIKAQQVKTLQKEGKQEEADRLYDALKVEYISLSKDQKSKVFKEIKHLTKS